MGSNKTDKRIKIVTITVFNLPIITIFCKYCAIFRSWNNLNTCENTHTASGRLASQQPSPRSAPYTAPLMQHQQLVVDHLTAFNSLSLVLYLNLTSSNSAENNRRFAVCLSLIKASQLVFTFVRTQELVCR